MSSNTATVETLTAEVRVLMVGSRQVTLSVYRQLDHVPGLKQMEAFGRVRGLKPVKDEYGNGIIEVEVVGRSLKTGELCRTTVEWPTDPHDTEWNASWRAAKRLPLIVLAGLR